jgi:hypothetical protein
MKTHILGAILVLAGTVYVAYRMAESDKGSIDTSQTQATEARALAIKEWPTTKGLYLACSSEMHAVYKAWANKASKKQVGENDVNLHEARFNCENLLERASVDVRTIKESKPIVAEISKLHMQFVHNLDVLRIQRLELKSGSEEYASNTLLIGDLIMDYVTKLNTYIMILNDNFTQAEKG